MALVIADRVQETTSTTGTGALALAAAMIGFQRFADVCAVNDNAPYSIFAVDGNGNPSGDWETGLGTYSATNTLTRTTVRASSNGGAAVNFGSGTKYVMLAASAAFLNGRTPQTQSASSYTAVATDAGNYIRFTSGSSVTFTIPPNSSVAFPIGTEIQFCQAGAGAVSVAAGSGVTLNSRSADLTLAGQYSVAFVKKVATNEWDLNGDL